MAERTYNKHINELYRHPKNVGSFDKTSHEVGSAIVGKPQLGMVLSLQIKVNGNSINDACFKAFGCGAAIATGSYLTETLKGMSVDDALKLKSMEISQALSLPPVKMYCAMLAEQAVKAAIECYRSKSS